MRSVACVIFTQSLWNLQINRSGIKYSTWFTLEIAGRLGLRWAIVASWATCLKLSFPFYFSCKSNFFLYLPYRRLARAMAFTSRIILIRQVIEWWVKLQTILEKCSFRVVYVWRSTLKMIWILCDVKLIHTLLNQDAMHLMFSPTWTYEWCFISPFRRAMGYWL